MCSEEEDSALDKRSRRCLFLTWRHLLVLLSSKEESDVAEREEVWEGDLILLFLDEEDWRWEASVFSLDLGEDASVPLSRARWRPSVQSLGRIFSPLFFVRASVLASPWGFSWGGPFGFTGGGLWPSRGGEDFLAFSMLSWLGLTRFFMTVRLPGYMVRLATVHRFNL